MKKQVDTLIIGGGAIGVCVAYFLSMKGRQVTLIERGEVGSGCSYGNAGFVAPSHIVPVAAPGVLLQGLKWMFNPESPFYIKPRLDLALLSWLSRFGMACRRTPMLKTMSQVRELAVASLALFEDFARMDAFDFHFKQKGSLTIYRNPRKLEASVKGLDLLSCYGVTSRVLGCAETRGLQPKIRLDVAGGIYFPEDAHMNPSEFVSGLASRAKALGVVFLTSTEVLSLEISGQRVATVRTTDGEFTAEHVVLAAGSWSPSLANRLGWRIPIQPAKGYSISVKSSEMDDSIPLALSESKVVVTPMGGILRFAGTLELAGLDFSVNQRRVDAIRRAVGEYLEGMDQLEELEIWRGLRPLTPDGLPIIGKSTRWENLILATGHGMMGLALGPITGRVVAQMICGETPDIDLSALGESRFQ